MTSSIVGESKLKPCDEDAADSGRDWPHASLRLRWFHGRQFFRSISGYLVVFFVSLFLIAAAISVLVDWAGRLTGTTLMPAQLSALQSANRKTIVFRDRIPAWGAFKAARIAQLQPEVVFIGSSRANPFRAQMFAPYSFYNAALTAWTIDQTRVMLEKILSVASPKVVVFSLDYWMFSDLWTSAMQPSRSMDFDIWPQYKYRSMRGFLETLTRNPSLLRSKIIPLLAGNPEPAREGLDFLGIDAMLHEIGFRPDGSFLQPASMRATTDGDKNFRNGVLAAFPGGRRYDQKQADALERLVTVADQRGVRLIAVQLPFARSATNFMDTDKSYHRLAGLWRESHTEERRDMLRELGVPYYDLSTLLDDNTDFLDAAHPTEKAMIKVLLNLGERPEFRAALPRLDTPKLEADLAGVTDPEAPAVYPNQ
jgi:hypothetical protein